MKIIRIHDLKKFSSLKIQTSLCIGNFDGLHLGHLHLLKNCNSCITFFPHTKKMIFKEKMKFLLPFKEKMLKLRMAGIENVFILYFNESLFSMSHIEFFDLLVEKFNIELFRFEESFVFGKNKLGDASFLKEYCASKRVNFEEIKPLMIDGIKVSSGLIKNLLQLGDIKSANKTLGYNFFYEGVVVHGEKNGVKIGFPTANLQISNDILPIKQGVYIVKVYHDSMPFEGICNIGTRPTFNNNNVVSIEAHIFDFHQNLYGKKLRIEFLDFLRDEKKFSDIKELREQIKKDIPIARGYFNHQ